MLLVMVMDIYHMITVVVIVIDADSNIMLW